tara:strand:+ start:741 stop:1865 length:1125 start_codon:yes stop_codon:yes gene_type:complete
MLFLGLLVMFSSIPTMVSAQGSKEKAKALFKRGNAEFKAKRYSDALDAFKNANAESPHPVMLKYIGNVYKEMYDYGRAIEYYRRYINQGQKDASQIRVLVAELQAERSSWPALKLKTNPQGASIRVRESGSPVLGTTPLTVRLPAGPHEFYFEKAGYSSIKRSILFEGRGTRNLTVTLSPLPGQTAVPVVTPPPVTRVPVARPKPLPKVVVTPKVVRQPKAPVETAKAAKPVSVAPPVSNPDPSPSEQSPSGVTQRVDGPATGWNRRTWSWVGMGTGGALLIGGLAAGAIAMGTSADLDTCRDNSACARTDREVAIAGDVAGQALAADILVTTGIIAAGVGLTLYFMSGDAPANSAFMLMPSERGVTATGLLRF